jgi:hypothetical protein
MHHLQMRLVALSRDADYAPPVAVERAWAQLFEVVCETMATSIREGMDHGGAVHELIRAAQVSHASCVQGPFEVRLSNYLFIVFAVGGQSRPQDVGSCG